MGLKDSYNKEEIKILPKKQVEDFLIRQKNISNIYRKFGCTKEADECDRIYEDIKSIIS